MEDYDDMLVEERPSSPIFDDVPLVPKMTYMDTDVLFKAFQGNISALTSAYDFVKAKLKNFDRHLVERVNAISVQINRHIDSLLNEIEALNGLLVQELDEYANRLQADKLGMDKSLLEIEAYLGDLKATAKAPLNVYEVEVNTKKLVEYQQLLHAMPGYLGEHLYSFTFEPSDLKKLTCKETLGCLKRVQLVEKFEFNFSANYKRISKDLWLVVDCPFNQHLILIEWNAECFHVLDRKTVNYIQQVPILERFSNGKKRAVKGLCVLNDRRQVCIIDNTSSNIYLLNESYKLIKQIEFYDETDELSKTKRCFEAVEYSADSQCFYILDTGKKSFLLFDDQLNYMNEFAINLPPFKKFYSFTFKIFQNRIYLNDLLNKCYHVFDEAIAYLNTFAGTQNSDEYSQIILADVKNNYNYLLVFNLFDKTIEIYDAINFEFIKKIEISVSKTVSTINNAVIIDNMIVFLTDHDLQVFDIV